MKKNENVRLPDNRFWQKLVLIMKLTTVLFLAGLMQVSATVYSQATKFALTVKNEKVSDVLREIEDNSNFRFFYQNEQVDVTRRVTVKANDETVEQILDEIFKDEGISYKVLEDYLILLSPKNKAFEMIGEKITATQQQHSISGTVTDESGQPLPGVTVVVKRTTQGTVTNADGYYTLPNIPENATLVFSFVGMQTQEVVVGSQTNINIGMAVDAIGIEEVVAIGYGTVRKKDLTGSISTVTEKDFSLGGSIATPEEMIQGRAAGVQISTISAQPGSEPIIRIRGNNSIKGSNQPLFVVDGLPMASLDNLVSVEDIKSMEILKDASAAAIYGTRGANGVVIITTKRGIEGKTNINYSFEQSIDQVSNTNAYDFLNAQEYVKVANYMAQLDGAPVPYTDNMISIINKYGEGTDWMKEIFKTGKIQRHNLSVNAGTKDTRVFLSANYMDWKGVVPNTNFDKFTAKLNLDQNLINERLKLSLSSIISSTSQDILGFTGSNLQSNIMRNIIKGANPIVPVNIDDWSEEDLDVVFSSGRPNNPIEILEKDNLWKTNLGIISNVSAELKIVEGLTFTSQFGIKAFNSKTRHHLPAVPGLVATDIPQGSAQIENYMDTEKNLENFLRYTNEFNGTHSLTVLAIYSNQSVKSEGFSAAAQDFVSDNLTWNNLGAGATILTPSSYIAESKLISYTGRIEYGYADRYNFTATIRRDGSSKFGANNKWGNFPSLAAAWKVHNENFFNIDNISNLKIRAGWGITGSDRFPIGARQAKFNPGAATTLDSDNVRKGVVAANLGNEDLQWEETKSTNIGLELGLFQDRINLEVDIYRNETDKLLWDMSIPTSLGFSSILANVGKTQNQGYEILLSTVNVQSHKFRWTTNFTFARNDNMVKKLILPKGVDFIDGPVVGHLIQISALMEGQPYSTFYGYKFRGILQEGQTDALQPDANPGDALYEDINGDGVIGAPDRTILGHGIPTYTFGLGNRMTYGNFELSFFFQGVADVDIMNLNNIVGYDYNTLTSALYDRWTPENTSGTLPLYGWGRTFYTNDANLEKGDYISLKNLRLAYNFPTKKMGLSWIKNLTIDVSATNLFVLTNYKGFHPEVNSTNSGGKDVTLISGVDSYAYPQSKTYSFGIKVGF